MNLVDNGIEYLAMSLIFERTKTKQPTNVKVTKPRDIFLLYFFSVCLSCEIQITLYYIIWTIKLARVPDLNWPDILAAIVPITIA